MSKNDFKTKGFSYHTTKDIDVIKYIEKQPNQSRYIWTLVRNDMYKSNDIETMVKRYIEEALKNNNIKFNDKKENNISSYDIEQLLGIKAK